MDRPSPEWEFVASEGDAWTWRRFNADWSLSRTSSQSFSSYGATTGDALEHGFSPTTCYWAVTFGGRTTHYRPGKIPITMMAGLTPQD